MIGTGQRYDAVYLKNDVEIRVAVVAWQEYENGDVVPLVLEAGRPSLTIITKADHGKFLRLEARLTPDEAFYRDFQPVIGKLLKEVDRVLLKHRDTHSGDSIAASLSDHDVITYTAEMAHEVNRAYCQSIGDDSQPSWADAPDWQRESALAGVKKVLENPLISPAQLHDEWSAHKFADGWVFGPVKDAIKKTHPCLCPYAELPASQRVKDNLFRAVATTALSIMNTDDVE